MTRIGWVSDGIGGFKGGAELSSEALVAAAPAWAEIVPCPPENIATNVDAYVALNVVEYDKSAIKVFAQRPVIKSVRDQWPIGDDELRSWFLNNSKVVVFNSPVHRSWFLYPVNVPTEVVPPPVDLERFREAAKRSAKREGTIWIGAMHWHKGTLKAVHWAREHKELVHFYGGGTAIPRQEAYVWYRGKVAYDDVPDLMAGYERFLYLPRVLDGFGRVVVEAWASGLELILGGLIGAEWYLKNDPAALENSAERFWEIIEKYVH